MKNNFIVILFLFVVNNSFSQEHAWVYLKDKPLEAFYLQNPLEMLSQKALDRRAKQNIALDVLDVPVSNVYIHTIKNTLGITVMAKSKWMNALHIFGSQEDIEELNALSFVNKIDFAADDLNQKSQNIKNKTDKFSVETGYNYGTSANQIEMLKGDVLHQNNFTGKGMTIAIMDGGFPGVDTFSAFQYIRDHHQILGGYNFVGRSTNFYTGISHGTSVLSTMAAVVDDALVGTAPDANYYLFITEDGAKETPLEESLWVEAAETADSLGVDILNTSLGYSTFDDTRYDYTYTDMDGKTTFITRGADIAFSRGMVVVNSAGNSGTSTWHYITAPADGVNVLAIGAVDASGTIASFSSYGPTFDNRVKPDVLAKGRSTTVIDNLGNVTTSNGTSFSSPVICGVIACFWQQNPTKTNKEIVEAIKASSHLYNNPNDHEGYGIPNFTNAQETLFIENLFEENIAVYPNPFDDKIYFNIANTTNFIKVVLYNILGRPVLEKQIDKFSLYLETRSLEDGIYFLSLSMDNQFKTYKLIKN